jgi:hypothetical protein
MGQKETLVRLEDDGESPPDGSVDTPETEYIGTRSMSAAWELDV